jgi:hypothetical protein
LQAFFWNMGGSLHDITFAFCMLTKPASCAQSQDLLSAQVVAKPPLTLAIETFECLGGHTWWNKSWGKDFPGSLVQPGPPECFLLKGTPLNLTEIYCKHCCKCHNVPQYNNNMIIKNTKNLKKESLSNEFFMSLSLWWVGVWPISEIPQGIFPIVPLQSTFHLFNHPDIFSSHIFLGPNFTQTFLTKLLFFPSRSALLFVLISYEPG